MEIKEKQLCRIVHQEKFHTVYHIKEEIPLVLNSIHIYAIKDDCFHKEIDFDVFSSLGNRYIKPRYNPEHCDYFLLIGERLAMCKIIEIKADDYIDMLNDDGNFTFTLEEDT